MVKLHCAMNARIEFEESRQRVEPEETMGVPLIQNPSAQKKRRDACRGVFLIEKMQGI